MPARHARRLAAASSAVIALCAAPAAAQDCTARAMECLASVAEVINEPFRTPSGGDARTLRFARIVRGVMSFPGGPVTNIEGWFGVSPPCPPRGAEPSLADSANDLDCWAAHVNRVRPDGLSTVDGDTCCYEPWRGAIFDLGGEGNRVAVFPIIDHGPLPCEAFEYTVWLTNNPDSTQVAEPGRPDANKWNVAQLTRTFLQGWIPDAPTAGQPVGPPLTPNLSNPTQVDGFSMVYSLPCGLTFRYASLIPGNNGTPSAQCAFHSYDAELDAVAGLNEDNTAICADADGDGFRDRACGGNDCDDRDRAVNPGAVESCAAARDLNCDGRAPACPANTTCVNGLCAPQCVEGACPEAQTCVSGDAGATFCLPSPCASVTCPAGQVCGPRGCQDPCTGAACPSGQVCRGGACVDPCAGVLCPPRQHCEAGRCAADCSCVPCAGGATCNARTGRCDAAGCGALACPSGSLVDCSGATPRCVRPCEGVTCPLGARCDAASGRCVSDPCAGVSCPGGTACREGRCERLPRMDAAVAADATASDAARNDATSDAGEGADAQAPSIDAGESDAGLLVPSDDGGCGCRATGRRSGGAWALGAALAALLARRRKVSA